MDETEYKNKVDIIDNYILQNVEPTLEELKSIYGLLIKYIKENKILIFGGLAINKFLPDNDKIYNFTENTLPDIDVYSDNSRTHVINMSNMLFKNGYTNIIAKDGVINCLNNTLLLSYNIYYDRTEIMNCVSMNKKMYDRVPKKEFDGILFADPEFQKMDMLLALTNSITAFNRWEKDTVRYDLIQQYYPYKMAKKNPSNNFKKIIIKDYLKPLINQPDVVVGGTVQYLFLMAESGLKKYITPGIVCLEIYSTDPFKYIEIYKKMLNNVEVKFYDTFSTILSRKYVLYEKREPKVIIYDISKRPTQFKKFKGLNILSYDMLLLTFLCDMYMYNIVREPKKTMIYYLDKGKDNYFKKEKIDRLDDSIFQSYVVDTKGEYENMQFKYKVGKLMKNSFKSFKYEPSKTKTMLQGSDDKKSYREKVGDFIKIIK